MPHDFESHARCSVLGVHISAIDMAEAVRLSDCCIQAGRRDYIAVTGVHGIMEAQSDPAFLAVLNGSFINAPDGVPTVWVGRAQGHRRMSRVYGPDFMLRMFELSLTRGYRHFLYGGGAGVAGLVSENLSRRYPGIQIVGAVTPPYRPLHSAEEVALASAVKKGRPDILWVGLGTPKQERFMAEHLGKLNVSLMVGVGAAFDIHAGRVAEAPAWMKDAGLQWLHRFVQEPRRLGRRYLVNNPRFLWDIALQLTGLKDFERCH